MFASKGTDNGHPARPRPDAYSNSLAVSHADPDTEADKGMIYIIMPPVLALALYGAWKRDRGAWRSNRAVWALAASLALTNALRLIGAPFDLGLWVLIDVAVIVAIETGKPGGKDKAVAALMVPCWVLYQLYLNGNPVAVPAITLIVAVQFLLTVPWDRLEHKVWKARTA